MERNQGKTMSTTLKDVAREAHVSVASVSRALNGTGVVTDRIRARVLEVAARLQYVPNSGAQSLMTRRTRVIGVLLPDLQGEYFAELIRGIDIAARARGLHLLISTSHNGPEEVGEALRAMTGRVDGLLIMAPHIDKHALQERLQGTLPAVLISTVDTDHTHRCVYVDNAASAYAMVKHLAGCGHRFIAHIAGPAGNVDAQERLRGYRDALAHELPGAREYLVQGNFTEDSGYRAGCEILAQARRPDAIFAANDMMAIGCLYALTEAGVNVPRDVALAGFDDIPTARFVSPPLTTVRVKIADLGSRALERLATWIENPDEPNSFTETVPAELVVRASCGSRQRSSMS
jgi:LacI family transcriptional regulator